MITTTNLLQRKFAFHLCIEILEFEINYENYSWVGYIRNCKVYSESMSLRWPSNPGAIPGGVAVQLNFDKLAPLLGVDTSICDINIFYTQSNLKKSSL